MATIAAVLWGFMVAGVVATLSYQSPTLIPFALLIVVYIGFLVRIWWRTWQIVARRY